MDEQKLKTVAVSEAAEPPRILVVDDHQAIREVLSEILNSEGYVVRTAENGAVALQELMQNHYNLVLTDLRMPVMDGEKLLKELAKNNIKRIVIVLTAFATVETAIETMKCGAYDYIMKPFKPDEIRLIVKRALEKDRLERENAQLEETLRLYQISEEMNSTLSLDRLLELIVLLARKESEGDVVSLVLRDQDDDKWYSKICDPDVSAPEIEGLLDLEAIGKAHALGRAILFPPGGPEPYVRGSLNAAKELHSFMSIPLAVRGKVTGMLNVLSFSQQRVLLERDRRTLYMLVNLAANAVDNARLHEELKTSFQQTIKSFSHSIDAMDSYTHLHSEKVSYYCQLIAREMGLEKGEVEAICNAATLHDIGKILLGPEWLESLNKPHPLSEKERKTFRKHPQKGREILEKIDSFQKLVPIVYHHHEHYDGHGYPDELEGNQIPLGARILAVADAYDAMTSGRPYRKAMSHQEAVQELRAHAGTQFDPRVVEALISIPHGLLASEQEHFH